MAVQLPAASFTARAAVECTLLVCFVFGEPSGGEVATVQMKEFDW
jgi:hypothetical protein